jgi:peptide-methionine (R)-S-oxide reductase
MNLLLTKYDKHNIFKRFFLIFAFLVLAFSCVSGKNEQEQLITDTQNVIIGEEYQVMKTEKEWRELLSPEEYYVLRDKGTEKPFSGDLYYNKKDGTYYCAGCGNPLFSSGAKFNSGTGWPSFYEPVDNSRVEEIQDTSHGMIRTEVTCARCGGHLGHVFDDGPRPTGLRYCINSVSLDFVEE